MTKEFAALIFIGLLVLVVLVYAVFSTCLLYTSDAADE